MTRLASEIEAMLPFLRRYARAMTGSRERGDALAEATLMSILDSPILLDSGIPPKLALFQVLQDKWSAETAAPSDDLNDLEMRAQLHLSRLHPGSREALLLRAFEQFDDSEISTVMRNTPREAAELVRIARLDLAKSITGRVLVIEDDVAIADEIEQILSAMGHSVIGSATTRQDAVRLADADEPDLILSDIQLADNTSGIDAVSDITSFYPAKPVIFVTAFPEMLLQGVETEPAFLITKPYLPEQVRSAVSQAMFFAPRDVD